MTVSSEKVISQRGHISTLAVYLFACTVSIIIWWEGEKSFFWFFFFFFVLCVFFFWGGMIYRTWGAVPYRIIVQKNHLKLKSCEMLFIHNIRCNCDALCEIPKWLVHRGMSYGQTRFREIWISRFESRRRYTGPAIKGPVRFVQPSLQQ